MFQTAVVTAEVPDMLNTTVAAVDSALRRARAQLAAAGPVAADLTEPDEQTRRTLLDGYVDAFTRADPDALVNLLRADVELEMPPTPTWFTGQSSVVGFLASRVLRQGRWRMVPTPQTASPLSSCTNVRTTAGTRATASRSSP